MQRLRDWASNAQDNTSEDTGKKQRLNMSLRGIQMKGISDHDMAQLQSDNYSIGELIEQEKTKLARLETELARTIDKPMVPLILSPSRWEPTVPRTCMGISKMTTANSVWPDQAYLTISLQIARSTIPPTKPKNDDRPNFEARTQKEASAVQNSPNVDHLEKRLGDLESQLQELESPSHESSKLAKKPSPPTSARRILRSIFSDYQESPDKEMEAGIAEEFIEMPQLPDLEAVSNAQSRTKPTHRRKKPKTKPTPDSYLELQKLSSSKKLHLDLKSCGPEEEISPNEDIGYAERVRKATDGISNLIPQLKSEFYRRQLEQNKGNEELAETPAPEHDWSSSRDFEVTSQEADRANLKKSRLIEARPDIELRKEFYTAQFEYSAQQKDLLAKRFQQIGETSSKHQLIKQQKSDQDEAENDTENNANPNSNDQFPPNPLNTSPAHIHAIPDASPFHHQLEENTISPSLPSRDPFRAWSSPNAVSATDSNFKGQSHSPNGKSLLFSPCQRYTRPTEDYQNYPETNKPQVVDHFTNSQPAKNLQMGEASPPLRTPHTNSRKKIIDPSPIEAFPVTPGQIVVNYYTQHTTSSPKTEKSDVAFIRKNKGGVLLKLPEMESETNDVEVETEQQFLLRRKEIREQIKLSGHYREPARIQPPEKIEHCGRIRFSEFKPPKSDLNALFHKRGGRGRLLKNKSRITNAIKYRLLPGKHNTKKRNEALRCLDWSGADTFVILLRRIVGGCKVHFRGMYQVQEVDGEHILDPVFTRIYGDGPKKITTNNLTRTFKFDVATKSFKTVSSTGWSIIVDGFEIGKMRTNTRNGGGDQSKPRQKRRSNRIRPRSTRQGANRSNRGDFAFGMYRHQSSNYDISQMLTASGLSRNLWTNVN